MSQSADPHQSYNPGYFPLLIGVEDAHFWFRARNRVITNVVERIVADLPPGYRTLEIGCGTGSVLRSLEQAGASGLVVGLDLYAEGLCYAHRRTGALLVQGDLHRIPFRSSFHLVGMFDVLEHLTCDQQGIDAASSALARDGRLVITVPAHPSLWSDFDVASHHRRRYLLEELAQKLVASGYRIEQATYFMASTYPLLRIRRLLHRLLGLPLIGVADRNDVVRSELRIVPLLNEVMSLILRLEAGILTRTQRLPWGASLLIVARNECSLA